MNIEPGLRVRRLPYLAAKGGDIWEVLHPTRCGDWRIKLIDKGPHAFARPIGYEASVEAGWFIMNCEIVSIPSAPAPTGNGMMFARVTFADGTIETNQHDGTIDEMISWIIETLCENPCATADWWGFDAQIYDEHGNVIDIDESPDLTAVLDENGDALVWAEA